MQLSQLRPMRIGDLLDTAFRFYRLHFVQLLTLTAVVLLPLTLLRMLLLATPVGAQLLGSLQNIFLLPLLCAALTVASACIYSSQSVTTGQAMRDGARRYLSILGATILQGLVIGLPIVVIGGCLVIGLLRNSPGNPMVWALLAIILLPCVVFLSAKYAITFPAIIIEGIGASSGMSRSWNLTKGKFWHTAGVLIATSMLTILLSQLPAISLGYIIGVTASAATAPWLTATQLVLEQLGLMIILPFQYLVPVVLYYDLRIRNEGYDLEQAANAANSPSALV